MRRKQTTMSNGSALFDALRTKAKEKGVTFKAAASMIGLSEGYLRAMAEGDRRVDALTVEVFRGFADFLEIPVIQVMLLAGVIAPQDFVFGESINEEFANFLNMMKTDEEFGPLMKDAEELSTINVNLKVALMLLYERAFRVKLLDKVKPIQVIKEKKEP